MSKNRNGSYKQLHVKGKIAPVFACPEAKERCPVFILDKYISKLPQKAINMDYFYARPLERVPSDPHEPWYAAVPVGKHTLYKKFNLMCNQS